MKLVAGMMLNESAFCPGYSDSHELNEISKKKESEKVNVAFSCQSRK
jgi:hypothetical protein